MGIVNANARLAVHDWDDTLHNGQTLFSWVDCLVAQHLFDKPYAQLLTKLHSRYQNKLITYTELVDAAGRFYASGIKGRSVKAVEDLAERFVQNDLKNIFPFVRPLIDRLASHNIESVIISGSPIEIISIYGRILGASCPRGTKLIQENGFYTGKIERNTGVGNIKARLIEEYADHDIILALGDSVADLPLLSKARLRIVVGNPDLLPNDTNTFHLPKTMSVEDLTNLDQFLNSHGLPTRQCATSSLDL